MESGSSKFSTRELSKETWPDFETLFLKPAGVVGDGWWCWCTHHHIPSYSLPEHRQPRTRSERAEKNRAKKREFVMTGCAHGILVYAGKRPVGWCQYGLREELPRIDNSRNYKRALSMASRERLWRITCFVVDREYRNRGVATKALMSALDSIREDGGGLVEGYPVSKTDQGPNYLYSGTVSMFENAGFKIVGPLSTGRTSTVVMRRQM